MLAGSRGGIDPVSDDAFRLLWDDPVVRADLVSIGIEVPEQLGALFIADRDDMLAFSAGAAPLVDDYPGRLTREGQGAAGRDSMLAWADVRKAVARFDTSRSMRETWPEALRGATIPYFVYEGYMDDVQLNRLHDRRYSILDEVLRSSSIQTLPLRLMGSYPRIQEIARGIETRGGADPAVGVVLGIGHLARREYVEAVERLANAWEQDPGLHIAGFYQALTLHRQARNAEASAVLESTDPALLGQASAGRDWLKARLESASNR
jgi:hypothetical protein